MSGVLYNFGELPGNDRPCFPCDCASRMTVFVNCSHYVPEGGLPCKRFTVRVSQEERTKNLTNDSWRCSKIRGSQLFVMGELEGHQFPQTMQQSRCHSHILILLFPAIVSLSRCRYLDNNMVLYCYLQQWHPDDPLKAVVWKWELILISQVLYLHSHVVAQWHVYLY